jgi:1-acyl-sn-glycerol-3-phosphate acyltransferase
VKIRGTLTVAAAGLVLVPGELIQRTVIAGIARWVPTWRDRVLAGWQRGIARLLLGLVQTLGGARVGELPRIPSRTGVLVLMNHQSLLDIPLAVRSLERGYPCIVTRARYARGKPLISHMVRLYQYPTVDPGATSKRSLAELGEAAALSHVPLLVFPEGTRTRDGGIRRFKKRGLHAVLGARRWEVWVMVVDGYWSSARLEDFLANVGSIRGSAKAVGPFTSPEAPGDIDGFIGDMEERMRSTLQELRAEATHP